jgi:hypothetical protein
MWRSEKNRGKEDEVVASRKTNTRKRQTYDRVINILLLLWVHEEKEIPPLVRVFVNRIRKTWIGYDEE